MEILVFAHGLWKELNGPPSRPGTRFMTVYLADCQVVIKMLLNGSTFLVCPLCMERDLSSLSTGRNNILVMVLSKP